MKTIRHIGLDRDRHIVDVEGERVFLTDAEWEALQSEVKAQDNASNA